MRIFLTLVIAGLSVTLLGFALLFGSLGGGIPLEAGFVGILMIIVGPLMFVGGLLAYVARRPTAEELGSQDPNDQATWHFRPLGVLVFVVILTGTYALAKWVGELFAPGLVKPVLGRDGEGISVVDFVFGLLAVSLLAFRPIRDFVYFAAPSKRQNESATEQDLNQAEPSATTDGGRDAGSS